MEYTSIATTPGIATELVQDVWDLAVRECLNETPTARQFVDVRPIRPMAKGSSVTIEKFEYFSEATLTAMKAALGEETDVDSVKAPKPTPVTITPAEHGAVVARTRKLDNRTFAPIDPYLARLIADSMAKVVDELLQDQIIADTTATLVGGGTGINDVIATDVLTAAEVRKAVTRLRTDKALPWFGGFYAGLVHPHVVLDLRVETGAGGWRVPNEYGASQDRIWRGEIGEFEGARFVENARVRTQDNTNATPNRVYQNYIIGRGALAEHVLEEPHVVIGPVTDNLNRFHKIGWYGDFGFKVFETKAIKRIVSSASLEADL